MNVFDDAVISESGSDALRDAISAISAPVANQHLAKSRFSANIFGSASVAGANVSNFKSSGIPNSSVTFLEKFASVTQKTRELESNNDNSNATGTLGSRRSSIFNNEPKSPQQLFREPRKQSFSEKLESYISATASPSASRHLSFSSDVNNVNITNSNTIASEHSSAILDSSATNDNGSNGGGVHFKNHWNPATAAPFHPSYPVAELSFMQQQSMMMSTFPIAPQSFPNNGFFPHMVQPFVGAPFSMPSNMMPNSKASEAELMKPSDTTRSEFGSKASDSDREYENENDGENGHENDVEHAIDDSDVTANTKQNSNCQINQQQQAHDFIPVGLNRSASPYIFTPFNPYGMYSPNGNNSGGFPPIIPAPGSPIGATPPPGMMMPPMVGVAPVGPRGGKGRSNASPIRNSKSPVNSNKKNSKASKGKNKHIVRSPVLEEFRNNKDKKYTLNDIVSHGYEFAKDQHGSRFIQQELANSSDADKELFFKEIRTNAIDLMTDVFGNYVIQKYFEHGTTVQKKVLFESMRGSFNSLSLQMYGCRVVQRCLEGVPLTDQLEIMEELKPNILNLVKDQNGNHVIQKAIEQIPIEDIPFILDSLRHQIYHLSMHPYGCRVIQRLLECSSVEDQDFILNELKGFIYYLVQDQFGNYVIQHVIESGKKKDSDIILQVVLDNLIELSKHKFASNAVEKCIINLPNESRIQIYETMLKDNLNKEDELSENSNLMLMIKDPFANYVVQKMVEIIDIERKKVLVFKIRQYLKLIQKNSHGKHLASIEKLNHICRNYDV